MDEIQRIAAFSHHGEGGNPAGVLICDQMPNAKQMLQIAAEVGYSETAFLQPQGEGWRIRYFAPEIEIPFCGHATIAAGSALAQSFGPGNFHLFLNEGEISVEANKDENGDYSIALQSPGTHSEEAPEDFIALVLKHFNLTKDQLDENFPLRFASGGARHFIMVVKDRKTLTRMEYAFEPVKALMLENDLATISLIWQEGHHLFQSRNAFASGGVYEDPATGAAAAALAGYLRDIHWPGGNHFEILQGVDMGCPSHLIVDYTDEKGASIKISGKTRAISSP